MAMKHADKIELAKQVKRLKELGYTKTKAIEKLHKAYLWKKSTISVYWKTFNE